jgi:hypothetical protein
MVQKVKRLLLRQKFDFSNVDDLRGQSTMLANVFSPKVEVQT